MPQLWSDFDVCYNANRVTMSKVAIPLGCFAGAPQTAKHTAEAVQQLMARHHISHDQQIVAWVLPASAATQGVRILHSDHVSHEIGYHGMPACPGSTSFVETSYGK